MSVEKGKTIVKENDIASHFKENVLNPIINNSVDIKHPATIFGKVGIGQNEGTIAFTNENGVPLQDVIDREDLRKEVNQILDQKMTGIIRASDVHNVMMNIMKKLTVVRNFSSSWHTQKEGALVLVGTTNGKAAFKRNFNAVLPTYQKTHNKATVGWERNGLTVHPNFDDIQFKHGEIAAFEDVKNFHEKLLEQWKDISRTEVIYKFITCHSNCHDSCHGSGHHFRW